MARISVARYANELGISTSGLLKQLKAAGLGHLFSQDYLTEREKARFLEYQRNSHKASADREVLEATMKHFMPFVETASRDSWSLESERRLAYEMDGHVDLRKAAETSSRIEAILPGIRSPMYKKALRRISKVVKRMARDRKKEDNAFAKIYKTIKGHPKKGLIGSTQVTSYNSPGTARWGTRSRRRT